MNGSPPIRVAHVMGRMLGGGAEAMVMNYYRHIDRSRVQFDFLVGSDSSLVPRGEIEDLGGRVFEVPSHHHVGAWQRELRQLFSGQRWRIVHSHVNAFSVFSLRAAVAAGVPVRVSHSHLVSSGKGEPVKHAASALLRTQANRYPTHRLACSRCAGEWLFGADADFRVVCNAIDLPRFAFSADARTAARAELGIADGQFVIGHVGRFAVQKNHMFLLEAFALVAERREDAVLVLVGDGGRRPAVERRAAECGLADRVLLLGQMENSAKVYQAFDAFAMPSLYEGLGIVGIEAQRAGLPCLLSNRITREVDVTGTVRFLPIDDPRVWADALCAIEPDERARDLGPSPACFADYDIELAAPKLVELYGQMLEGAL